MPTGPRGGRWSRRWTEHWSGLLRHSLLVVVAGLLTPSAVSAQTAPTDDEPLPRSPIELLVQQQAALGLTPQQLGRLDRIRDRLAVANEPLVSRMMRLRAQWQQERRAASRGERSRNAERVESIRAAAEQTRTRIQRNNRTAMQAVNRLLTADQRAQLRSIIEERRQQNPGRRGGGPSADGSN